MASKKDKHSKTGRKGRCFISAHHVIDIELEDQEALVEALREMEYKPEIYAENVDVYGYSGRKVGKATVVVRKYSGKYYLYGDIGFEKQENGNYKMHYDGMDVNEFSLKKLKQLYAKHKIIKHVKANSTKYILGNSSVEKDGKIRIRLQMRNV